MTHILYIDPGTSSYLVQAIVAGSLAVAFFFKDIVARIKSIFKRKHDKD